MGLRSDEGRSVGAKAVSHRSLPRKPEAVRERAPALMPTAALIAGILLDRWVPLPWIVWLAGGTAFLAAWVIGYGKRADRLSAVPVLLSVLCVGGGRHHQVRSVASPDDISRFARETAIPVRLRGRIVNTPVVMPKNDDAFGAAWPQPDYSIVLVQCGSVRSGSGWRSASGTVRVQVTGHLLHVLPGDRVEAGGWLTRPNGPRNPGEHDMRKRLRRDGVRSIVYAEHPDAVERLTGGGWSFRGPLGRLRERADRLLTRHLRGDVLAVASAILLGNRRQMETELRNSFVHSGMMHLLAISGLHVGLLAWFVWMCARGLQLRRGTTAAVVITGVVAYAFLTDVRPSIVRATIVVCVFTVGTLLNRRISSLNSLSVAALGILLWNPLDLFHVGAQLSFLSVLGIVTGGAFSRAEATDESAMTFRRERNALMQGAWNAGAWVGRMYWAMACIWVFALPLIAARFHIISPMALLLNIVLLPWVVIVLWCGYVLVFGGLLVPVIQSFAAVPFAWSMRWMVGLIDWAAGVRGGHVFVPGPSNGWLWGYYVLLLGVALLPLTRRMRWRGWCAVCVWLAVGLSLGLMPKQRPGLRCTFLSVGHGLCVLVELPDGRVLLYDAGSLSDGERATRRVQQAMWSRGHNRLNGVVVSHADVDHFNGIPGLLDSVPVDGVLTSPAFPDFQQQPVKQLCDMVRREGVPIRLLRAGDSLCAGEGVTIRVLHPDDGHYDSDNAASIVVEIVYAGRRILLTGDVEADGQSRLLQLQRRRVDVLLAPHHGSLGANPVSLAEWAEPRYVVVSGGRRVNVSALRARYTEARRVSLTSHSGAVTVEISPTGELTVQEYAPRLQGASRD